MNRLFLFAVAASLACTFLFAQASRGASVRNAIFNGDFLDGKSGWIITVPDGTEVLEHKNLIGAYPDSQLSFRNENAVKNGGMYSQYSIKVGPGRTYALNLNASGEGEIRFGVFEYDDHGRNTIFPMSDRIALTPEKKTYTFTYKASVQAASIRPKLEIYSGPIDVRLRNFELMLSQEEWAEANNWPEWAVSDELRTYTGFSEEEQQAIKAATAVEDILPPYEPIVSESTNRFKLTTSEWCFGQEVFPEDIRILGESVLAEKIAFELEAENEGSMLTNVSELVVTYTPEAVLLSRTVTNENWTLEMQGQLLYDALIIFDISVKAKEALRIERSSLSIPLRDEQAKYIRYDLLPDNDTQSVWLTGHGPIPQAGQQVETKLVYGRSEIKNDWNPAIPAEDGGVLWESNRGAPRHFWIGDEEKGLGWVTESDKGWHCDTNDVTWFLERTNDVLFVRVNFITTPLQVQDEWRIRFIMQAMPPKPVRSDWFKMRFNSFWYYKPSDSIYLERIEQTMEEAPALLEETPSALVRYAKAWNNRGKGVMRPAWESLPNPGLMDIGFIWHDVANAGCGSPRITDPDLFRRYLRAGEYVGHRGVPYLSPTHISVNDLPCYHYAIRNDDWIMLPRGRETSLYAKVCPNSFSSEYLAYSVGQLIDEYGIRGMYFDNTEAEMCSNSNHGCGWEETNGVTHVTYPFLAMRNFFKMARHQFVKRGLEPFIWKSGGMYPGEVSFVDANLCGEGVYGCDHTEMITPGEWRARWLGKNQFGLVDVYLPNIHIAEGVSSDDGLTGAERVRAGTPPLMAMALIHGTPVFNGLVDYPIVAKAWGVLDELTGPNVDFIPYWKWDYNKDVLNPLNLYASVYCQPDRAVLVVSNLGDATTSQFIKIPWSELAKVIPFGITEAVDNCWDDDVDIDANGLGIYVEGGGADGNGKRFRMISLSPPAAQKSCSSE